MSEEMKNEETMADFEEQINASLRRFREGDKVTGTVVSVEEEEVILDLNSFSQGVIPAGEYSDDPSFHAMDEIRTGETLTAVVLDSDDGQGRVLLSLKDARENEAWDKMEAALTDRTIFTVKVLTSVNGGVVAFLEGIRGFIPASQLALSYVQDLSPYQGKKLTVRVTTVDKEKKKLILSAKEILKEQAKEEHDHKVAMIVPGTVLEGVVESLQPYGAFVDLKDGLSGLVHISQICQKRIKKPSEVLKVGDKVKVKVLNTNEGKISLSIKAVEEDQTAQEIEELDTKQFTEGESVGTNLGDLFKKLGF